MFREDTNFDEIGKQVKNKGKHYISFYRVSMAIRHSLNAEPPSEAIKI